MVIINLRRNLLQRRRHLKQQGNQDHSTVTGALENSVLGYQKCRLALLVISAFPGLFFAQKQLSLYLLNELLQQIKQRLPLAICKAAGHFTLVF